jgi:hypothetical protein
MASKYSRPRQLSRGVLEVIVSNSTLMQELGFQKAMLLKALEKLLPDGGIKNLRFRVGNLE